MAAKLTEFAGAESELLFEGLAEGGVRIVSRCERNLRDIHRAHAQLASRTFHPQAAHIADGTLAHMGSEDTMEVGDGEACHRRQRLTVERLVNVIPDIALHILDTVRIFLRIRNARQHG